MARLRNKEGNETECERLQQRVLTMRRQSLGLHHEDTHRSVSFDLLLGSACPVQAERTGTYPRDWVPPELAKLRASHHHRLRHLARAHLWH